MQILVVNAGSPLEAHRQVSENGATVLSVAHAALLDRLHAPGKAKFPLVLFSQELLSLLQSGVSIMEAIETLAEKEQRQGVRQTLTSLQRSLREGKSLSLALEAEPHAFSQLYVATVRSSEKTGALHEALARYVAYATQLDTLRGKLVSAAIYPVMLISVSVLVILFLMGYVVPRFARIYEDMGSDLPFMSRLLLYVGQGIEMYWPWVIGGLLLLVVVLWQHGATTIRALVVGQLWRIPAVGEGLRVFELTRLYRTLGMLLRGGVAVVPASDMVMGLLNPDLRARLLTAVTIIREGQPMSRAFEAHKLTTPVALRMMRVGERTGNMGEMLERAAAFHDEEISRLADWVTRMLGPLLMLFMGIFIGGIVVLMYLPIFQLAESIR